MGPNCRRILAGEFVLFVLALQAHSPLLAEPQSDALPTTANHRTL